MKRRAITILPLVLLSLSSLYAAENKFEPGRIVSVEKKVHERIPGEHSSGSGTILTTKSR
jgi:hypothetical protein